MSENLDLVRSIYAPMERGDFVSWVERTADPEIEWFFDHARALKAVGLEG